MITARLVRRLLASGLLLAGACTAGESDLAHDPDSTAPATAQWDSARVDTLLRLGREDQAGREAIAQSVVSQDTAALFAWLRADSARTRWLRTTVARSGWPSRTRAGNGAHDAAWLILQHSPDTAWQAAMLTELERLASAGELPLADVALLGDRIRVRRGMPQRYGSQFGISAGRLVPDPVEDLDSLDARRASVGLPPMAEYVRLLAEQSGLPVEWPPQR